MAINVNTNVPAMTAQRYLNQAAENQNKSMERLSSGYKINSAKDDAAGLQISNRTKGLRIEGMSSDITLYPVTRLRTCSFLIIQVHCHECIVSSSFESIVTQ